MKAFLFGFGVGAGLAMLVAPEPGERSRKQLGRLVWDVRKRFSGASSANSPFDGGNGTGEVSEDPPVISRYDRLSEVADEVDVDAQLIDKLNNASKDELMSVNGIGEVTADRIIRHRPYESSEQLIADSVVPESTFRRLRQHFRGGEAA